MSPICRAFSTMFIAIPLVACVPGEQKSVKEVEKLYQLNPNPQKAYKLTVQIKDAPGPMKFMGGSIEYLANNCSFLTNNIEGVTSTPRKHVDLQFRTAAKDTYETVIYLDGMKDEDYFGDGICHWESTGFGVGFSATGKLEETGFSVPTSLFGEDSILNTGTKTMYYWKGGYPYFKQKNGLPARPSETDPNKQRDNVIYDGEKSKDAFPDNQKNDLFSITLTLEELKND